MKEIRIVWKIRDTKGNHAWYPETLRTVLLKIVCSMNKDYGDGTHWIEEREVNDGSVSTASGV